jgi:peptide/nickel transport system ATP-binding protein
MVARALLLRPSLLVADEPVSMIDASLRALVLGNLQALNRDLQIPIVYITHDLTTAYHIADVILVMYRGRVVEAGTAEAVIAGPRHPYTKLLVDSIPWPDLDIRWGSGAPIPKEDGRVPRGPGCAFAGRCPHVMPACRAAPPPLRQSDTGTVARCLLDADAAPFDDRDLSAHLGLCDPAPQLTSNGRTP